ncbi:MAG: PAS domain-containing protein [Bacteroidetes bacterium]|nr:PAS domain-containing protein [Bacteroidota bacterium]
MSNLGEDKAIDELMKLDQKLSLLITNSEESYILVDTEFRIVAFNRQFKTQYLKFFGTEVQKGDSVFKIANPERVSMLKKIYEHVFAGKTEYSELEIKLPNKDILVISNKYKPAFDEEGHIIGAFVTSADISELRKAEKLKRLAEEQLVFEHNNLKALINNTKSRIWSLDLNFNLISFNESFANQVYASNKKQASIGDSYISYLKDSDHIERFKLYINRVKNGESFSVNEHIFEPDEIWNEVSFNPIKDENKQVIGVACISTDITERKLFERSLIQNQNRLKQAQEIAHLGNWELSFITNSSRWSDEAYKIYGITSHNFDHTFDSWLSFVHPEDLPHVMSIIKKGYETLEDYTMYHRIIRPDGAIRYIYGESHFEFDHNGKPIGLYGISQDITDRRNNEIQLQELLKSSNERNKWLNNFTHIVSHNIKSHNNNINGIVDLMETTEDREAFNHLMGMLRQSTERLNETINNLAEYVSFQDNIEQHFKNVKLSSEIEKTCSIVSRLINEKQAEIVNEVDPDLELKLIPSFIESILLNLLSNALKYSSEKRVPRISFKSSKENGYIKLDVSDNGIGIDLEKNKDQIFGMYQTFHGNKDAVGFGLFITKNQIEAMGGKIEVESKPDQGTTFTIYLHEKA